jgi:hypothetical protein
MWIRNKWKSLCSKTFLTSCSEWPTLNSHLADSHIIGTKQSPRALSLCSHASMRVYAYASMHLCSGLISHTRLSLGALSLCMAPQQACGLLSVMCAHISLLPCTIPESKRTCRLCFNLYAWDEVHTRFGLIFYNNLLRIAGRRNRFVRHVCHRNGRGAAKQRHTKKQVERKLPVLQILMCLYVLPYYTASKNEIIESFTQFVGIVVWLSRVRSELRTHKMEYPEIRRCLYCSLILHHIIKTIVSTKTFSFKKRQ